MKSHLHRPTSYPIHPLLAARYSPRSFTGAPIAQSDLDSIFEAGRWAPSCMNEQPWRLIYARREDRERFMPILECLTESNREWACDASVLMITAAMKTFKQGGRPNRYGRHDVGLATACMIVEAMSRGIYVHTMAGFSSKTARKNLRLPEDVDPVTAVAFGFLQDNPSGDTEPSTRRSRTELFFQGTWGDPIPRAGHR